LTVLIADADSWFRDLAWRLLEAVTRVCEASTPDEAVRLTEALWPDVVLLGIEMQQRDTGTIRRLKAAFPPTRVVLMTSHSEEAYLMATGKSGADAFLPRHRARRELIATVRKLAGTAAGAWDGNDRRRSASLLTVSRYVGHDRRS
jgi:DNA-binding NarL/FixJ family response regulator